jgi:hypothetical protein
MSARHTVNGFHDRLGFVCLDAGELPRDWNPDFQPCIGTRQSAWPEREPIDGRVE